MPEGVAEPPEAEGRQLNEARVLGMDNEDSILTPSCVTLASHHVYSPSLLICIE